MRDVIFTLLMLGGLGLSLRKPWIGALIWVWMGLMNPHRYTYGFAFNLPWSQMVAGITLIGLLRTQDRQSPFRESWVPGLILVFTAWVTISWLNGRFIEQEFTAWSRVIKTFGMLLVMMALVYRREQIKALIWVIVLSLALLGTKGGLFTVATGGSYRVWGPLDSWVYDNNAFAVALIITIPLIRYLQTQLTKRWQRIGLGVMAGLCAAAALGSQSRGAFLAISSMALLLWWRGRNRLMGALVIAGVAIALLTLMPESWYARMNTIKTYGEDTSALGRLAAWQVAIGLANDKITGAGFRAGLGEYFLKYLGVEHEGLVAHSIYFEVLGQHGYIGLLIFVSILVSAWRCAAAVRKKAAHIPEAQWCVTLASMCQVSLLGYAVGGAFLTLAFYDLPYYVLAVAVLTRQWVERRGWETDGVVPARWGRALAARRAGPASAPASGGS
jgi:probable O-glycosylation ligase (exosortase A-associated)